MAGELPAGFEMQPPDNDAGTATLPAGFEMQAADPDEVPTHSDDQQLPTTAQLTDPRASPRELGRLAIQQGEALRAGNGPKEPGPSIAGVGDVALTGALNTLPAMGNAAVSLASGAVGMGTQPRHVFDDWAHLGPSGTELVQDIAHSDPVQAAARGVKAADRWVGTNLGSTAQDIIHQTGDVLGEVGTLIPGAKALGTAFDVAKAAGNVATAAGKAAGQTAKNFVRNERASLETPHADVPAAAPTSNVVPFSRQSVSAAQASAGSPFNLTGEETARGSLFPQVKLAKNAGDVPDDEVGARAGIVREVLDDTGSSAGIRTGVITGNEQTLRSEYQAAENPRQTEAGKAMKIQIAAEQNALPEFARQRIDATGADDTLRTDSARGQAINDAFFGDDSLTAYLNGQKQKIYQQALEKNGDTQIATPTTDALFADPQFNAGIKLAGHKEVASGAADLLQLAKTVGFKDPVTGAQYAPGSVAAYNAVTKAINAGWSPANKRTIATINAAINGDIAASGGGDLYKLGAGIHQLQKSLLSDSKGISTVFGDIDENGVQTAKPFEKIPQTLNDMPLDQWRHIHDTLDLLSRGQIRGALPGMDPVPKATMQAAARAKAEMEGALARDVYSDGGGNAGVWDANKANKALNGLVGQKILDVAPPDEVRKWHTLNSAGQIMPGRHPYEGAEAQEVRMEAEPGWLENHYGPAGAFLGTHLPHLGPLGPYVGEKIGSGFTKAAAARRQATAAANVRTSLMRNRQGALPNPTAATGRASGGRVDHEALVSKLFNRWKQAQKHADRATQPLLQLPDASITKALQIAHEQMST